MGAACLASSDRRGWSYLHRHHYRPRPRGGTANAASPQIRIIEPRTSLPFWWPVPPRIRMTAAALASPNKRKEQTIHSIAESQDESTAVWP
jgi:hypothetical protein